MAELKKMELTSASGASINLEALYQICPSAFTEVRDEKTGQIERKINFTTLRELLGDNAYEGTDEEYGFNWVGKRAAQQEAGRPINKTLRPCPEESVDWEHTQNLYIEGDNLDVLKLLQKSYLGAIKMIYIDPPYNTGNDFVYRDDFAMKADDYDLQAGNTDEIGNRFRKNTDSNARYHSDWCSMIYERLTIARNLLSNDGVIFISMDDHELQNLDRICGEVFGTSNRIGLFTILSNPRGSQNSKHLSYVHEYILMYSKSVVELNLTGVEKSTDSLAEFKEVDENGRKYRLLGLRKRGGAWRMEDRPNMFYSIFVNPNNGDCSLEKDESHSIEVIPKRPTGELSRWTWGIDKFLKEKYLLIGKRVNRSGEDDAWDIFRKDYVDTEDGTVKSTKLKTIWVEKETNYQNAKNEIKALFGNSELFDYPKPTYIIKRLAAIIDFEEEDIIIDFFSGSASTAHAVMEMNSEYETNLKFIMVQLPEEIEDGTEAKKAGYNNICELGKERIRRAGKKIKDEHPEATNLDTGFRVFKLAESNMQDVYFAPKDLQQQDLFALVNNVKEGREDLDLLFGCMLDWGVQLSLPLSTSQVDGKTIHIVNDGDLVACFDDGINEEVINAIAALDPLRVVFRDSGFESAPLKINLFEMFKQKCGWSEENVTDRVRII